MGCMRLSRPRKVLDLQDIRLKYRKARLYNCNKVGLIHCRFRLDFIVQRPSDGSKWMDAGKFVRSLYPYTG